MVLTVRSVADGTVLFLGTRDTVVVGGGGDRYCRFHLNLQVEGQLFSKITVCEDSVIRVKRKKKSVIVK